MDQYYTKELIIEHCTKVINKIVPKGVIYVDSSAGYNNVARNLKREYIAFDIDPPENHWGQVYKKDWLSVQKSNMQIKKLRQHKASIVVGFNPPYGFRLETARLFLNHSVELLSPDWFTIVIPKYGIPTKVFTEYEIKYQEILPKSSFYTCDMKDFDYATEFFILKKMSSEKRSQFADNKQQEKLAKKQISTDCFEMKDAEKFLKNAHLLIRKCGGNAGKEFVLRISPTKWRFYRANGTHTNAGDLKQFTQLNGDMKPIAFEGNTWKKIIFNHPERIYAVIEQLAEFLSVCIPFDQKSTTRTPPFCDNSSMLEVLSKFFSLLQVKNSK
jgi:hypothetical protein